MRFVADEYICWACLTNKNINNKRYSWIHKPSYCGESSDVPKAVAVSKNSTPCKVQAGPIVVKLLWLSPSLPSPSLPRIDLGLAVTAQASLIVSCTRPSSNTKMIVAQNEEVNI